MSLKSKIEADIKTAMKAKEKDKLRALRGIKSLILLEETKDGSTDGLSEKDEIQLLSKAAKQRRDSLAVYQEQGRDDLAEKEQAELTIIEQYLPKQLSEEELKQKLESIISEIGASGPQDMGKIMGQATKQLAGQADGKLIATMVKSILAG